MNITTLLVRICFTLTLVSTFVVAGPAFPGTKVFTQPDGTQFEGTLKGDSSFHWIESNGYVIIYNPVDKFYYKALIDVKKGLILTDEKPEKKSDMAEPSGISSQLHGVTQEDRKKLFILYKKSKTRNHPQ